MLGKIATALKHFRKVKGYSQVQVANLSGIRQGDISNFENDRSDMRLSTLKHLVSALDCRVVIVPKEIVSVVERMVLGAPVYEGKLPSLQDVYGVSDDEED